MSYAATDTYKCPTCGHIQMEPQRRRERYERVGCNSCGGQTFVRSADTDGLAVPRRKCLRCGCYLRQWQTQAVCSPCQWRMAAIRAGVRV